MEKNTFIEIMQNNDDAKLLEIIELRNEYQPKAAEAAINEAEKRGLIDSNLNVIRLKSSTIESENHENNSSILKKNNKLLFLIFKVNSITELKSNHIFGILKYIYSLSLIIFICELILRIKELLEFDFLGYIFTFTFLILLVIYFFISGRREIKNKKPIHGLLRISIAITSIIYSVLVLLTISGTQWSYFKKVDEIITMPILLIISIRDLFLSKYNNSNN